MLLPAVDVVTVPGRPKMELLERARVVRMRGILEADNNFRILGFSFFNYKWLV